MWQLGLIHQGRDDLGQDPAEPDNPVTNRIQSQDLAFTVEPKCLPANYCEIEKCTPSDCGLKLARSGNKAGERTN